MNVDILKSVQKIVVHGPCPDGRASALILRDALPERPIVHVQYGTPEHKALVPEYGVLFCDFTPWVERVVGDDNPNAGQMTIAGRELAQRWVDAGAIVLDHHDGASDVVAMFGERGVYADVKTATCCMNPASIRSPRPSASGRRCSRAKPSTIPARSRRRTAFLREM